MSIIKERNREQERAMLISAMKRYFGEGSVSPPRLAGVD